MLHFVLMPINLSSGGVCLWEGTKKPWLWVGRGCRGRMKRKGWKEGWKESKRERESEREK